jgi:hypothetical protein
MEMPAVRLFSANLFETSYGTVPAPQSSPWAQGWQWAGAPQFYLAWPSR